MVWLCSICCSGYVYDNETELYYVGSRYYNPETGRWLNADNQLASGDLTGGNLFAYCGNNPVNRIDPTGEAWIHWLAGAAIVAGFAALTVLTCGGSLALAATSVGLVANGIAAATTATTVAAAAFIGSATVYATAAVTAACNSKSVNDFRDQGNWGTVRATAGAGFLNGFLTYSPPQNVSTKTVPNPNGKKGGAAHQAEISRQIVNNSKPGYTVQTEVKINTPGGAKPYRYADFSVTNDLTGDVWYGNVGRQLKSGLPCARERAAIADIQNAGCAIKFFPYN